jgi:hypothetical protein
VGDLDLAGLGLFGASYQDGVLTLTIPVATLVTLLADGQPPARRRHTCRPCHRTKLSSVAGLLTPAVQAPVTPSRPCHVERGVAPAAWRAELDRCAT